MDISIVIVTWNNEDTIGECLNSIIRNVADSAIGDAELGMGNTTEILIIDNASSDNTVKIIERISDEQTAISTHFEKNNQNLGFARGNNQGISKSKGRYILLLNPDTVLSEGALDKMVEWMDGRPDVGILAPQLTTSEGSIQYSCREFPAYGNIFWELTGIPQLFPRFSRWKMGYFDHTKEREVDQPMASCIIIRREVLEEKGFNSSSSHEDQYLDENFPLYFNDVDLCYRIKKSPNKWKIIFSPVTRVSHHKGSSTKKMGARQVFSLHFSMIRYFKKHKKNIILFPLLALLLFVTALVRSVFYKLKIW
jgi:GT2 family glycosyltransferase